MMKIEENLSTENIERRKSVILKAISDREEFEINVSPPENHKFDVATAQFILVLLHNADHNKQLTVNDEQLNTEHLALVQPASERYIN